MERGAYIILYQLERRTPSDGGGRIWWYRVPSEFPTKIEKMALITEVCLFLTGPVV